MTGPPSLNISDPVAVLVVQRYLTRAGYFVAQDGHWTDRMGAQVLAYQRAHGLPATGIADAATLAALRRTSSSTMMPAVRPPER